ncbi:MAG: hypothetical protein ACREP8_07135, partial [Candidatus Binatia bacterium]
PEPLILYRIHGSSNTMNRFFEMRAFARFVRARQQARAQGGELPVWENFHRQYENAPTFKRFRRRLDDLSQFYYRRFAVAVAAERYVEAVRFLSCSAVLNPTYALPRAWKQRFARPARNSIDAAKNSLPTNTQRK